MKRQFFKIFICLHILYCLIFEFDLIKTEIMNASLMWFNIILPSVFPYLILSRFLSESDIADMLLRFPGKLLSTVFSISYPALRCLICSLICGYPSGAIASSSLYKNGEITKDEAQRLILYSNNAGPLFLISAVGASMLGSRRLGFAIYIIQLISAFGYGMMIKEKSKTTYSSNIIKSKTHFDICDAVVQSVRLILNILGFMLSAFVMSRICIILLEKFIPMHGSADIFIKGFFEISAGVKSAVGIKNPYLSFALICCFVSWSGLSVIFQIKSASDGLTDIKKLIKAKAIQSIMSFGLGYAYISIKDRGILSITTLDTAIIVLCLLLTLKIFIKRKGIAKKVRNA